MTDENETGFGFRIRPLPAETPPTEPTPAETVTETPDPPAPEPKKPAAARSDKPAGADASGPHTAGRFGGAQAALAFIGAVAGAGLASEARARRGPNAQWWVEVPVPWRQAATLAAGARGMAYSGSGGVWTAVPADGSAPPPPEATGAVRGGGLVLHGPDGVERLSQGDWPEAGLADLITASPLRPTRPRNLREVVVIAPGPLAADILKRAVQLGFQVEMGAAEREPLSGGPVSAAAWLRIAWAGTRTSGAFLRSLSRLPYVAAARPAGGGLDAEADRAALLVDIHHAAPLTAGLVAALVPDGEHWLLGAPDMGHWRVRRTGRLIDAGELIRLPDHPAVNPPPATAGIPEPELTPRLIHRSPAPGFPDALLLDEDELTWLREVLIGRPVAESAYLIPGPGRYLLLAPGGLPAAMPFGLPLRRVGPGGLHIQEGRALFPPLPETARSRAFPCGEGEIVAVIGGNGECGLQAFRFGLSDLTPVWRLWLSEGPAVAEGMSGAAAKRVRALAGKLQRPEPAAWRQKLGKIMTRPGAREKRDPDELRRRALALIQGGRYAEAAGCMEGAGDMAAAGRLYERAAEGR